MPDRQNFHVTGYSEDDADQTSACYEERQAAMRPLKDWINAKGLPFLRKEAPRLDINESRVVSMDDGNFHIEASPQGSYGLPLHPRVAEGMIANKIAERKAIEEMADYARKIRDTFHHRISTLIADHGVPYYMTAKTFTGLRGTLKQCYNNAFNLVTRNRRLTYVEGFVHIGLLPIEHAWAATPDGKVLDPTLRPASGETLQPLGYYGIPFHWDYVCAVALKTKVFGILSYTNRDLMEGKDLPETFLGRDWRDATVKQLSGRERK